MWSAVGAPCGRKNEKQEGPWCFEQTPPGSASQERSKGTRSLHFLNHCPLGCKLIAFKNASSKRCVCKSLWFGLCRKGLHLFPKGLCYVGRRWRRMLQNENWRETWRLRWEMITHLIYRVRHKHTHKHVHKIYTLQTCLKKCCRLCSEYWDLMNPEEKQDKIPEIWEGHNIADYIDPDIMKVLKQMLYL